MEFKVQILKPFSKLKISFKNLRYRKKRGPGRVNNSLMLVVEIFTSIWSYSEACNQQQQCGTYIGYPSIPLHLYKIVIRTGRGRIQNKAEGRGVGNIFFWGGRGKVFMKIPEIWIVNVPIFFVPFHPFFRVSPLPVCFFLNSNFDGGRHLPHGNLPPPAVRSCVLASRVLR